MTDKRGAESSPFAKLMRVPNQDKFFSFRTWWNEDSSSSYCVYASSKRLTPSKELAKHSYTQVSEIQQSNNQNHSTFRIKNVQKFQPGMCRWPSERLTSSSLCVTAESNDDNTPSLTLLISSAHTAGASVSGDQATCTHLITGQK